MVARFLWILLCLSLAACAGPVKTQPIRVMQQYQECPAPSPPHSVSLEHGPEGVRDAYNIEAAVNALGWWLDYISDLEACVDCYEAQAVNGTDAIP